MADHVVRGRSRWIGPRRLVLVLGSAVLALGPAAGPAAAVPPPAVTVGALTAVPSAVGSSGIGVELEQIGPTALTPGSQLVVQVRVTNTSGTVLTAARARLFVNSPALTDRASLDAWEAGQGVQGGDRFSGVDGAEQPLDQSLSPGESADVEFSVDADQLQLGSDFGARGVTVDVLDSSLQRLTALRTFLVWAPQSGGPSPAPLTVVAPVTAGAPDVATGQLPEARVEEQLDRLRDLLSSMSLAPASLVVDPALLGPFAQPSQEAVPSGTGTTGAGGSGSATPQDGADPSATGSSSPAPQDSSTAASTTDPASAGGTGDVPDLRTGTAEETSPLVESWLTALRGRTTGSTAVLPQGDTDVVATAASGTGGLVSLAVEQARASVDGGDDQAVLWPADPSSTQPAPLVVEAARSAADTAGSGPAPVVLLDARSVPGAVGDRGTGPSTAALTATAADGSTASATGVLVDAAGSSLLASATSTGTQVDPAGATARLLADTAVSAVGGGGVVLALPRTWDPDPSVVATVLGPVSSAPWVRSTALPDLLASAPAQALPTDAGGPAAADSGTTGSPLDAAGLQTAAGAVSTAERMATLVPDDQDEQTLLDPVETSAVAAASLGWRQEAEAWQRALGQLSETTSRLEGGVEIVEQSPTTVISSRVNLPVQIRNSLSVPVTVEVQLRSGSLRLVPESSVEKTIAPGTQDSVTLPVTAAASGDTSVTAFLTNSQGQPIGGEVPLRVRVRADWEGRGVAVAAGVAGLVFVGGIVRTVVRVRRRPAPPVVRSAEEAEADGPPTRRPEEPPRG